LFTDAEEPWLLGAQAFVRDDRLDPLDPRRSVVLNLEARGTSGPVLMFQSSSDNMSVIPALASVQRPITSSGWEACYQLLPGDTDFTVFRNAGFAGMNFAFFDGSARYHTPEDSPSNLDHASQQHMGSTVLATARHFAGQDLGAPRGGSLTYFTVLDPALRAEAGCADTRRRVGGGEYPRAPGGDHGARDGNLAGAASS
jgi:prepilin-type processing-associated H-X9-DG protein